MREEGREVAEGRREEGWKNVGGRQGGWTAEGGGCKKRGERGEEMERKRQSRGEGGGRAALKNDTQMKRGGDMMRERERERGKERAAG